MNITLHFYLIHFIYLSISIFLYRSIRISLYFLRFSYSSLYGLLTANSRLALQFSLTVFFLLQFPLPPTVASLTVGSVRFPLRLSIRLAIQFSLRLPHYGFLLFYSLHTLLSAFHTHYKSPLYSEYYLLLYLYSYSFLRFFLLVFFSHKFHSV